MNIQLHEDKYIITFTYDPALVSFVKGLQRARFSSTQCAWIAPRNIPNAIDLRDGGYFVDRATLSQGELEDQEKVKEHEWPILLPPRGSHQLEWQRWCSSRRRAMLVAEMGLGKTYMAVQWLAEHYIKPRRVIIACPPSLILNWVNELERFTGEEAIPVMGTAAQRRKALQRSGIHIVNYEYFVHKRTLRKEIADLGKTVIIMDEAHKIKNPSSQRSKVFHKYSDTMTHILLLTGTPISQGAQDYYSQFRTVNKNLLGASFSGFKSRYCLMEQIRGAPPGAMKITGYRRMQELTKLISPFTFTKLKKDCLDLPEKIYSTYYVDLSKDQRAAYNTLRNDMALWVNGELEGEPITGSNILTRMLRLSQITQGFIPESDSNTDKIIDFSENPKLKALHEIIEDLAPQDSLIIICRFKHDIKMVVKLLTDLKVSHDLIDGSVPIPERQQVVDRFQQGSYRFLVGQIQTIGVGFTLTRAERMCFFSNTYSLVDRLQAEDRIHRIGATGDSCQYIDIVARGTVDEEVVTAIKNKVNIADHLTQLRLDINKS